MKKQESHREALLRCIEDALGSEHSAAFKEAVVDKILRINARFNYNPNLDEALNSGDGSYKP